MAGTIGLICWAEKGTSASRLKGVTLALFVGDSIGFIVLLMAQLAGLFSALGWANVVLWLLLALSFGYFRFVASD